MPKSGKFGPDRQRAFCEALHQLTERRRVPWAVAINDVAALMGIPYEEAAVLAAECEKSNMVKTSHPRGHDLPHSVSLDREGWDVIWKAMRRPYASSRPDKPKKRKTS